MIETSMFNSVRRAVTERARCAKHNWLDGATFRTSYRAGMYSIHTEDGLDFRFPFNPYTSFFEIGGYLAEGAWRLEPGMWVLDAGGGRGEFALYASRKVGPGGRVIMLEPDPEMRSLAQQAFNANGGQPENLRLIPRGLWKEPGVLQFAAGLGGSSQLLDAGGAAARAGDATPQIANATIVSIEVQSLPSIVQTESIPRLDFVKMDIEGAEIEAIEGSGDVLERFKPRFSIASYHQRDGKKTCELLEPLFRKRGYHVRTGFPKHLTTYAAAESIPGRTNTSPAR